MNEFQILHTRLHSLVIFRKLLNRGVVKKLDVLLTSDTKNTAVAVDAYCDFVSTLFHYTEDFTTYLLDFMVEDENIYMTQSCKSAHLSETLTTCLAHEVNFLQELSQLSAQAVQSQLGYDGYLPLWNTHAINFAKIYAQRIQQLPVKGYGMFARYHVFTVNNGVITPVKHPDKQRVDELSGYENERNKVIDNTRALLQGKPAANVLLYGDAGTGKSSTVKAIANEFAQNGLRLIEVKKNQLYQIPDIVEKLSYNPLKFILFIDDLSFSENDNDFAALKAILEGSVNNRSDNLVVYATSNRRHLIKENFKDREGDEIHMADTMQELMSLSARFGLKITFSRPDKELYTYIVMNLAHAYGIELDEGNLMQQAEAFAIRNGGRSPRAAKQFIESLRVKLG